MTRQDYLKQLLIWVSAGFALSAALRLAFGAAWFSFYGWAAVALLTLIPLTWLLWRRLESAGRSRLLSLAYAVPMALLAAGQAGYWWAFFTYGASNPALGVVREVVRMNTASLVPWAALALIATWVWLFVSAARNPA